MNNKKITLSDSEEGQAIHQKILQQFAILKNNKIPLDYRGNEANNLRFETDSEELLNTLIDAMECNTAFKGNLSILSAKFNDSLGLKIANIIKNNSLESLTIWNRYSPFSDRVSIAIGDALSNNSSLKSLTIFLDIGNLSPIHITKFMSNQKSKLQSLSYLKLSQKMLQTVTEFINSDNCSLKQLLFYYEPLREVNMLYEKEITEETLNQLTSTIENNSNLIDVKIIPLEETFLEDINTKLTNDINILNKTLEFSCKIVQKEKNINIDIHSVFVQQNKALDSIIGKIDRDEGKKLKNSIVSVRSYLDRAIGESMNQALYDLEVQKERFPEKKELFTAKGSIRYVAQYLLNNKS